MLLARIFFGDIEYNVIFNSVNLEKFAPKMSKNNDDLTFIHVGRYTYQKNQEFIIKIFFLYFIKSFYSAVFYNT